MSLFPQGTPNLLGSRGGNIDANNLSYKNCVEYVEYDTLFALITAHCTRRTIRNHDYHFKAFDESFLLHLFRSLVTGLRDMNHVSRALAPTPLEIFHGDLHPGNVFLSREDMNVFRLYPTPKIADFGASYATHAADPDNRDAFDGQFHTAEFNPPELVRIPFVGGRGGGFQHFGAADAVKALSPSNIYQVGAVILCAMRLQTSPWPLINPHAPNVDDVDPARPLVGTHTTAGYSQGLKDLVHRCLRWHPGQRPNPTWLLARIAVVGAPFFGADTMEGYAAFPAAKPTAHRHKLWLGMTDSYRQGMLLR
ncbi:kinase-like domain-containing protein [Delphinella strobiligena]|nr:kinase-like domain-containing protein [Delphinella strobiligena]